MTSKISIAAATIASAIVSLTGATAATAATSSAAPTLQQRIDNQIHRYGGKQVSPFEVSYDHGKAIVVFEMANGKIPTASRDRAEVSPASPDSTDYWEGCPYSSYSFGTHWFCFYQNQAWNQENGGRMLEFSGGGKQSLVSYGFSNETSSWVNTTNRIVTVYGGGNADLWAEGPNSDSYFVGKTANDRAQWFTS